MIPVGSPPRPLSASEQSLADRFTAQLTPTAQQWSLQTAAVATAYRTSGSAASAAQARRAHRRSARQALWKAANRSHPMGLGVVELFILQWVIGQLLNWIMRSWLSEGEAVEDD